MDRIRFGGRCRELALVAERGIAGGVVLFLIGLSALPARAEVRCSSSAASPNNFAEIGYSSRTGLDGPRVFGNATANYGPDGSETRQQFFFTNANTLTSTTSQTSDLPNGRILSSSDATPLDPSLAASAGSRGYIVDRITFNNRTLQPAEVVVTWTVQGSFGATVGNAFSRATYYSQWHMESPALALNFLVTGYRDNNPNNDVVLSSASGWDSFNIDKVNGGFGGVTFTGVFTVRPGNTDFDVYGLLDTAVVGEAAAFSHFGNGAVLHFSLPADVSFTSTDGTLNAGSRLLNISSRAEVRTGDSAEIAGFIVTGSVPKRVLIRALGPSLSAFGVANALADPTVQLNQNGTVLTTNDNWRDTQQTEIENSGLSPSDNLESALIRTLNPGSYTAILRGKNNGTGVGMIEVYDLEASIDAKLANISTRGFINAGDNVLIGGIIGGGNGSQPRVLIRAIGPSLAAFGVADALQDPVLELHDADGRLLVSNDDWEGVQKSEIEATGLAPGNAKESAILATLLPAHYTAIVRGAGNTSGVGLVEVYHLQ